MEKFLRVLEILGNVGLTLFLIIIVLLILMLIIEGIKDYLDEMDNFFEEIKNVYYRKRAKKIYRLQKKSDYLFEISKSYKNLTQTASNKNMEDALSHLSERYHDKYVKLETKIEKLSKK